ncbi:MAG: polymer-forming cytoskeletal protein [Anaerolineae bacterium]|nr:polymer-forming cytoskeletal protein [Anaerolineae bacterium]
MRKKLSNAHLSWIIVAVLITLLLLGSAQPAQAAIFDDDGVIAAGEEINDDVFLSAETVSVSGIVNGLLVASGNTITVDGKINGDAIFSANQVLIKEGALINGNMIVMGNTVMLNGQVTGSLIGASANVTTQEKASIGRNIYYAAYSVEIQPGTLINRGIYAGAYQVVLGGEVAQDAVISAEAIAVSGKIGKNAKFEVGVPRESGPKISIPGFFPPPGAHPPIKTGLNISREAQIGGQLSYTSQIEQDASIQSKPQGGVVFATPVPDEQDKQSSSSSYGFMAGAIAKKLLQVLRDLVTLLIIGALVLWLIPTILQRSADQAKAKPLPAAGYGLVTILLGYAIALLAVLIIILIGVLLSVISLGGLSSSVLGLGLSGLTFALTAFTLLISYGSKLIAAFIAGEWIMNKIAPNATPQKVWALGVGILIYVILRAIPILGWLIGLATTIVGIGAMWLLYRSWKASNAVMGAQA